MTRKSLPLIFRAAILLPFLAAAAIADQPSPKLAIPSEPDLSAALKEVHAVYREGYLKRDISTQSALAETLHDQAIQTRDNAAARYVMFRESRSIAAALGDIALALKAADDIHNNFDVDLFDAELPAFQETEPRVITSAQAMDFIIAAKNLTEYAMDVDRADVAATCARLAVNAAEHPRDPALLKAAADMQRWIAAVNAAAPQRKKAGVDLLAAPDDPANNLLLGRYLALDRNRFDRALPYLAKGSDSSLKSLADAELSPSPDPDAIAKIADAWWDIGSNLPDWQARNVRWHAVDLYNSVLPRLTGISADRVKKQIAITALKYPPLQPTALELLDLFKTGAQKLPGAWSLIRGEIVSADRGREFLPLQYQPPDEYDLIVEFKRLAGDEDINLLFQVNGSSFALIIGGWHNTVFGVDEIRGQRANENPASATGKNLVPAGQKSTVIVHVRRNSFDAQLDGKFNFRLATDYKEWSLANDWRAAAPIKLGLATQNSSVAFTSVRIIEISGRGHHN